jgi:hypothetical protein
MDNVQKCDSYSNMPSSQTECMGWNPSSESNLNTEGEQILRLLYTSEFHYFVGFEIFHSCVLLLVFCSMYSTRKMETICSSEKSASSQRTTQQYISEGSTVFTRARQWPFPEPDEYLQRPVLVLSSSPCLHLLSHLSLSGIRSKKFLMYF